MAANEKIDRTLSLELDSLHGEKLENAIKASGEKPLHTKQHEKPADPLEK